MSAGIMSLSPAQSKLLIICFKHMSDSPTIDFDKVATEYGYKDAKVARAKYSVLKATCKTLGDGPADGENGEDKPAIPSSPATPASKATKRKAPTGSASKNSGPVKKRGRPSAAQKAAEEEAIKEEAMKEEAMKEEAMKEESIKTESEVKLEEEMIEKEEADSDDAVAEGA